jgi:hypothetical protein
VLGINPYQYYPGSDKKQPENIKGKISNRSLNNKKSKNKSNIKPLKKSEGRKNSIDAGDMVLADT